MKQPNILYILADQLRHDVFGFMGDEKAQTPNIDRLAGESVRMRNATVVTPVCTPYRASLFTGKYTSSTAMVINETCINPNHHCLADELHEAGYRLGYLGKWHLVDIHQRSIPQGPARLGFQHGQCWRAYNFNHHNYHGFYWEDEGERERRVEIDGYQTDTWTRMACDFIEAEQREDNPFALVLSWSPPHDPWTPENCPPGYYERFADVAFPDPPNFKEEADPYADRMNSPEEWARWKERLEDSRRCYYAMVAHLDDKVGELLDTLERTGQAENTIVILTSDHGEMFGAQGRVFKTTFYDEAVRVPFLLRWPAALAAGERDTCFNSPDISPTLLGLIGRSAPAEMEGMDCSQVLCHGTGPEPACAFMQGMGHTYRWVDGHEWRAVRTKRHTYARYLVDGSEHCYDNQNDPYQTRNLIDDPAHAGTVAELRAMMAAKMRDLHDGFHPLSHYRSWMADDDPYTVVANAYGPFAGPHPPTPSLRKNKH